MDQEALERMSTEDPRNFPGVLGAMTHYEYRFNVCNQSAGAKDAFLNLWGTQIESPGLKSLARYSYGSVPVLLYPFLYKALKLTFLTDVAGIVSE